MPARFPYLPVAFGGGDTALVPLLPLRLWLGDGQPVEALGLVDSGATVNVLPHRLGLRLGAIWEEQTTRVILTGNLATHEARALLVAARVVDFGPVRLVFAWSQADNVPLLLGQVNFFDEFDVRFRRAQLHFEIQPSRE
jgi:hypothetical protein